MSKIKFFIVLCQGLLCKAVKTHATFWQQSKDSDYLAGRDNRPDIEGADSVLSGIGKNLLRNYEGIGAIDSNPRYTNNPALVLRYGTHANGNPACYFAHLTDITAAGFDLSKPFKSIVLTDTPPTVEGADKKPVKKQVKGADTDTPKKQVKKQVKGADTPPDPTDLSSLGL